MKNIRVLPTNKPSKLFKDDFGKLIYSINMDQEQNHFEPQHLFITSDEVIKEGDSIFETDTNTINVVGKDYVENELDFKIILTTDPDLIKDGVQAIDDEFLEWFVKNPSCEEVEVETEIKWKSTVYDQPDIEDGYNYKIIIPKEEPKQETLEEAAENYVRNESDVTLKLISKYSFKDGAKWQAERRYSEEEVFNLCREFAIFVQRNGPSYKKQQEWFEQFKKK